MNISLNVRADSLRQIEATINENIARINARIEDIRVKTEIDVSKLGTAASEFDKAKAHVQGLNRELDLQNQKLAEMKRALGASVGANGLNNVKTINLQTEIQKQIQAIDRLKAKINELNRIQPPKNNNLLSGYLNIKGDVVGKLNEISTAFSNLRGATSSADNAITATLGVIGNIPHPVGRAVAAFAAMPVILKGVESSIVDLTRAVTAAGDSTYVMSRGFQMSLADTGKFTAMCKTAGVEVNDLASTIKRTQQQIIRGGDDSKAEKWLRRYGESAFDANGHLKNLNDMTLTLSRALKKAQAEGNGMNFILGTMRSASADAITAIEDAEDVYKQAAGLVKNGLIDAKFAHEVQGNINAMNLQAGFMHAAFDSALLPVANEIIPRLTERMGKVTQVIADNKDMIRDFGRTTAEAFLKIESAAETVGKTVGTIGRAIYDFHKDPYEKTIAEKYKFDTNIESVDDLIQKEQSKAYDIIKANPFLYQQTRQKYEPIFKALKDIQEEIKRQNEAITKEIVSGAELSSIGQERRSLEQNPEILESLRKARKYQEEAETILYKMNHGDFANRRQDVDVWWNQLVREGEKSNEELEALTKVRTAKLAQIEKEYTEKIAGYYKNAADLEYEMTHTAFEKQIRDIELWKEATREKAETEKEVAAIVAEAAAKEAQAFEREVDRIKNLTQSLEDEIYEMENSQYEADKRRALQKAQRALEEGVDMATVQRFLQDKLGQLNRRADESRKSGGDYTKTPEGARQFGGNGILVIESDKIVDDGLMKAQSQAIGLLTDENLIRQQLLPKLDTEAREAVERIQATKQLTAAQQDLLQSTRQAADGFQLIEGDKFSDKPTAGDYQVITGDQVLAIPAQELQQFSEAVQQTTAPLQPLTESAQGAADAQKSFADGAKNFPPEYFQNLADSAKSVSETQMLLTNSTLGLIDAQSKLADALKNLPSTNQGQNISNNQPLPTNEFMQLSNSTQDLSKEQDLLARTTRETDTRLREISDIPPPRRQDEGFTVKPGFDYETAKDIFLTGVGLSAAAAAGTGGAGLAFAPEILLGSLFAAGVGGVLKGSVDETTEALNQPDERLKEISADVDLSAVETSLASIDEKIQSFLQAMETQEPYEGDQYQELFGTLPNIEEDVKNILLALQSREEESDLSEGLSSLPRIDENVQSILQTLQSSKENPSAPITTTGGETVDYLTPLMRIDGNLQSVLQELQTPKTESTLADYMTPLNSIEGKVQSILQKVEAQQPVTFETIITPLDRIAGLVQNILAALGNRQPPQITIAPNNSIDLGGAYVFDNEMKQSLVNDITKDIVDEITTLVRQAISQTSYGYSA